VRTEHPYRGRTAVLGTRHGKQRQLAVPLMGMVGLEVRAVEVDTDALGTFTAEVPRLLSMREAAIAKARLAMEATDCTLGLGSEGTIGADPQMPLLNSDRELIVLVDQHAGAITSQSIRSFDITVATTLMKSGHGLEPFLRQADFPRHRLIVRPDGIEPADLPPVLLRKAVADPVTLIDAITACARASPTGRARVESDLRAHCSPSRQEVIAKVAWSLGYRLARRCPECTAPGWGTVDDLRGLACDLCGMWIAEEVRGQVLGCGHCGHQVERPNGRGRADPAGCPACNP